VSGLAGLVAGHDEPGVWRWRSGLDVADVRRAVESAGWTFGHVDGAHAQTRAEVLDAIGRTLAFPAYYGRNLDALADCLRDLPEPDGDGPTSDGPTDDGGGAPPHRGRRPGVVLLWDDWGLLGHDDPRALQQLLAVLGDRAAQRPPFAVLLRGEGPQVDVPLLD